METQIYNKLTELINIKGTNDKCNWVKTNLSNDSELAELILNILKVQFDTRITTNLAKKSMKKNNFKDYAKSIERVSEFLNYITNECTGKDIDIANVLNYLSLVEEVHGKNVRNMFEDIAIRNLKLGVTANSINKALGKEVIYDFNVWKGHALKDYSKLKDRKVIVTPKIDGYRSLIYKDLVYSPNGKAQPLSNFPDIEEQFNKFPNEYRDKYIFDGEMIYNRVGLDRIERYNMTSTIMGRDGMKKDLCFNMFDRIFYTEFKDEKATETTENRKVDLKAITKASNLEGSFVKYVEPLYVGNDIEIIQELFMDALRDGDEGLILQTCDSFYETKKVSDGMWKLKIRDTGDLKVLGFEEGKETGKNKGTLGMMYVEYKGFKCGVGTGFKELVDNEKYPIEHTRDWIWENRDNLIGKIVEVEYDENKNKDGGFNLRHGSFLRWRFDKTEPSI